jgi:hypothetical protein
MAPKDSRRNLDDSRVVWFAELERARHAGDLDALHRATVALERLGVRVVFFAKGRTRSPLQRRTP